MLLRKISNYIKLWNIYNNGETAIENALNNRRVQIKNRQECFRLSFVVVDSINVFDCRLSHAASKLTTENTTNC